MPRINECKCNKCDLRLPRGSGCCLYVEDDNGKRVHCYHPNNLKRCSGFSVEAA